MGDTNKTPSAMTQHFQQYGMYYLYALILVIVAVLIYYGYQYYKGQQSGEYFTDPNALDPATKALLAYHLTSDPVGIVSPKLIGGPGKPSLRL